MRKLYIYIEKGTTLSTLLSWYHYVELLVLDDTNEINYYISIVINSNLSVRQLRRELKTRNIKD